MDRNQAIEVVKSWLKLHGEFSPEYIASQIVESLGCRLPPADLKVLDPVEQMDCSLISKYCFAEVADVIKEACLHQRDYDLKQIKKGTFYRYLARYSSRLI